MLMQMQIFSYISISSMWMKLAGPLVSEIGLLLVCLEEFAATFQGAWVLLRLTDVMSATDILKHVNRAISTISRPCRTLMTMIHLQSLIGLLLVTNESHSPEPGAEISHFPNSLPVLLEQLQLYSHTFSCCRTNCCFTAKKQIEDYQSI